MTFKAGHAPSEQVRAKLRAAWTPERRQAQAERCRKHNPGKLVKNRAKIAWTPEQKAYLSAKAAEYWTPERRRQVRERVNSYWANPENRRAASFNALRRVWS